MKKIYLVVPIVGLMATAAYAATPSQTTGAGVNTLQYHSYDGLICTDCHTLHASENGAAVDGGSGWVGGTGYSSLLKKGDVTDMCLSCHKEGFNNSANADLPGVENTGWTAPAVMSLNGTYTGGSMPAGDFYYSKVDPKKGHNPGYTFDPAAKAAATAPSTFTSKLMEQDTVLNANPPGGDIKDGEWSCHSCHGMHSRFSSTYTAYRQIKRTINKIVTTGSETVTAGVETNGGASGTTAAGYEPIKSNTRGDIVGTNYINSRKDLQPLDGADLFMAESDTNKNVYRGGFSSMCSACHGEFHGGSDQLGTAQTKSGQNTKVRTAAVSGSWIKHPTNLVLGGTGATEKGSDSTIKAKYGVNNTTATKGGYNVVVANSQGATNPNPVGYDWKYPLVVNDANTGLVSASAASAATATTLVGDERIMCLTCHKAHASQFENMTRWDTNAHSFIKNGDLDPATGVAWVGGDNPAFGCGKCHQKGGAKAYVKNF